MNEARSIKQNARADGLPDFRNLGVILRILIISNGLALVMALVLANRWGDVPTSATQIAMLLAPVVLLGLLSLWLLQPWLNSIGYWQGVAVVSLVVTVLTLAVHHYGRVLFVISDNNDLLFENVRYALLSLLVCSILLLYFRVRARVLSQGLLDARLQVLRARIRPHFLFNTINAVLGIIRTQPKQAEAALEDMADLFRVAMAETGDLVPLTQEVKLCKQYLALEQLRMGDRLQAEWEMLGVADDTLIPPLLLQPLLENAVYHGIESLPQGLFCGTP
jgi:two-component system sensor histidine kinase AlgZ